MAGKAVRPDGRARRVIGLLFCEDQNDAESLKNLVVAIWPAAPRIEYCRKPLILVRDLNRAQERKKNASKVMAIVKAKRELAEVRFVIAHQDCDAVEPAHTALASKIRDELTEEGVPNVVPAAPAWEIEAWWYQWPRAVAAVNSKWRPLNRTGNHGMLTNAKEMLRRDLRANGARDYEESDSPRIAQKVKELGILNLRTGTCGSFIAFRDVIARVAKE